MGVDYSYKIVVKKESTDKVLAFVNRHGDIGKGLLGECADIYFTLDKDIIEYLKKSPRKNIEEIENKEKIGCIYVKKEEIENGENDAYKFQCSFNHYEFSIQRFHFYTRMVYSVK